MRLTTVPFHIKLALPFVTARGPWKSSMLILIYLYCFLTIFSTVTVKMQKEQVKEQSALIIIFSTHKCYSKSSCSPCTDWMCLCAWNVWNRKGQSNNFCSTVDAASACWSTKYLFGWLNNGRKNLYSKTLWNDWQFSLSQNR